MRTVAIDDHPRKRTLTATIRAVLGATAGAAVLTVGMFGAGAIAAEQGTGQNHIQLKVLKVAANGKHAADDAAYVCPPAASAGRPPACNGLNAAEP